MLRASCSSSEEPEVLANTLLREPKQILAVDCKFEGLFNTHIDAITKKAKGVRARRNLSRTTRNIKATSYKTYIRPKAEYASVCWDPHIQKNIKKVEQVQRSSARYVTGNYARTSSTTSMLNDSLESRRCQSRLNMLFKIRYGLVDVNWRSYLTEVNSITRGHSSRLWVLHCNTQVYQPSFFQRTSRD